MTIVLMPIEVVNRELPSKVFLATLLANRGVSSLVGRDSEVLTAGRRVASHGVLFRNSCGDERERRENLRFVAKGIKIVAQDEEAGITWSNFEGFFDVRGMEFAGELDSFFSWSRREHDFLTSMLPGSAEKLLLTGGMRAGLWGEPGAHFYETQTNALENQFGPYVLFSTNFGSANPLRGHKKHVAALQKLSHSDERMEAYRRNRDYQTTLIESFIVGAKSVLENTKYRIVIRPGVGESEKFWRRQFHDNPRVTVTRMGEVSPWLLGASAVVQNSSTAGVESVLLGTPTIQLDLDDSVSDGFLVKEMGLRLNSGSEIGHLLNRNLEIQSATAASASIWRNNLTGAGSLSPFIDIANRLEELVSQSLPEATVARFRASLYDSWPRLVSDLVKSTRHLLWGHPSWVKKIGLTASRVREDAQRASLVLGIEMPRISRVGTHSFLFHARKRSPETVAA